MGMAVKKIIGIPQKYVLPAIIWTFLPFKDTTAETAAIKANAPARICIINK